MADRTERMIFDQQTETLHRWDAAAGKWASAVLQAGTRIVLEADGSALTVIPGSDADLCAELRSSDALGERAADRLTDLLVDLAKAQAR